VGNQTKNPATEEFDVTLHRRQWDRAAVRAIDGLRWPAPTTVKDCHGGHYASHGAGLARPHNREQRLNGLSRVLAGKVPNLNSAFGPSTRITGLTWLPRLQGHCLRLE
jgi:hypothetical protein